MPVDGRPVAEGLANAYRPDVQAAWFGPGRSGFSVSFPVLFPGEKPLIIRLIRESDGAELPDSPRCAAG